MGVNWGVAEPKYETGVSHGVFFGSSLGTPWNGLVSVEEVITGGDPKPVYLDGRKIYNKPARRVYQSTVRAFTIPEGFDPCQGYASVVPGVILTGQPRSTFGFAYQTLVGNFGKRIHVVYNVTATPKKVVHSSITGDPEAELLEWRLDAVPPVATTHQPTAHLIIDSTRMEDYIFQGVENLIYGTDTKNPSLPTQDQIRNIVGNPLIEPLREPV